MCGNGYNNRYNGNIGFLRWFRRKKNICEGCSEDFNNSYFLQIMSEYNLLSLEERNLNPAANQVIFQLFQDISSGRRAATCDDIYTMEKALIQLQSLGKIRLEREALREKYREVVGHEKYSGYLNSVGKLDDQLRNGSLTADEIRAVVLGEINFLMSELHLKYTLLPFRENQRTPLLKSIGCTLLIFYAFLVINKWFNTLLPSDLALYFSIMAFGSAGAYISLIQRLHAMPIFSDPIVSFLSLKYGRFSILLTPITGAVFSIILYLMFNSGLLKGDLFPAIVAGQFPDGALPKLYVWAFIAGFAERFVPDTLDRLIAQKSKSNSPGFQGSI